MAASFATELALMPVSARIFSRITVAGIVLNLIAVPVMAIVQVAGMLVVLLDRVAVLANAAGVAAYLGAMLLVRSAHVVEWFPWLSERLPPPPLWIVVAYYSSLCAAIMLRRRRLRRAAAVVCAAAAVATFAGIGAIVDMPRGGILRWTIFDVGQGDAMALQWGGHSLVVDTGGAPFGGGLDIGPRVLAPALWARGMRTVDTLLVTHGDPDHIGGAPSVIDIFSPRRLWLGVPVPTHAPSQELIARASTRGVAPEWRRAGEMVEISDVRIRVLNPPPPDWERQRVRNDDSLVIEVVYRDVALLLTGDISAAVEREIAPHLTFARTRILKVAHHGSRTSSSTELLDRWRPQIAVISCGRGNTFGHPAPEVIDRLESIGARIYRTDRDGEVTIDTDGDRVEVRTFLPGRRRGTTEIHDTEDTEKSQMLR
jgi:competence protein ComEC